MSYKSARMVERGQMMNSAKRKNTRLEPEDMISQTVTGAAKGTLKMEGKVKLRVHPGDTTVNHLLAFFSLVVAPILVIATMWVEYLQLNLVLSILYTVLILALCFLLILRTKTSVRAIQKIVNFIKSVEL